MIELALALERPLQEVQALTDQELATVLVLLEERAHR